MGTRRKMRKSRLSRKNQKGGIFDKIKNFMGFKQTNSEENARKSQCKTKYDQCLKEPTSSSNEVKHPDKVEIPETKKTIDEKVISAEIKTGGRKKRRSARRKLK